MVDSGIYILGSGPSGLIAANYLKKMNYDFRIITLKDNGFSNFNVDGYTFKYAQRTMFYNRDLYKFVCDILGGDVNTFDLSKDIGVFFKGRIHDYPIQNNLSNLCMVDKIKFYASYLCRPRLNSKNNYAAWSMRNYGKWLAQEVLIPHTWKTIKEDLHEINAEYYGKKVIKLNLFKKRKQLAFKDTDNILRALRKNVEDKIIEGNVSDVGIKSKSFVIDEKNRMFYRLVLNTIPLNKFIGMVNCDNETIQAARYSLHYNNMFIGVFVLPSDLIKVDKNIVYFPERDYVYSKVNITRLNGISVIVTECSFRRNDEDKFKCKAYLDRYMDRIESDLKRSGMISSDLVTIYQKFHSIISPCYIITDSEYISSKSLLLNYLEHNGNIYGIGRFAMWEPWARVEHSYFRMIDIYRDKISKMKFDKSLLYGSGE